MTVAHIGSKYARPGKNSYSSTSTYTQKSTWEAKRSTPCNKNVSIMPHGVDLFSVQANRQLCVVHIRAPIALYPTNTQNCIHLLLCRHFINTTCNCSMFKTLKGHLQEGNLIHSNKKVNKMSHQMYDSIWCIVCIENVPNVLPEDNSLRVDTCCSDV